MIEMSSLAEQGEASSSALPTAGAPELQTTSSSIPLASIASRQESATKTSDPRDEGVDSSSSRSSQTTKPKNWSDYPKGYPRLAALRARGINTDTFRSFDILTYRILAEEEARICTLGQALWDLDEDDERDGNPKLKNLAFDYEQFLETCFQPDAPLIPSRAASQHDSDPEAGGPREKVESRYSRSKSKAKLAQDQRDREVLRDRIMQALFWRLTRYQKFVLRFIEIRNRKKLSTNIVTNVINLVKNHELLNGEGLKLLSDAEGGDFFTTRNHSNEPFEALLYQYGRSKFTRWISDCFIWIFQSRDKTTSDPGHVLVSSNALDKFERASLALFCSAMLLAPVAILLLVPLSDSQSLWLVVAFVLSLVIALSLKSVIIDQMLIILSAYIAVLSALVSNLGQGSRR